MMRAGVRIAMVAAVVLLLAATATAHFRMDLMDGYRPRHGRIRGGGGGFGSSFMPWTQQEPKDVQKQGWSKQSQE
ncbi:uncharacterized protein LOC123413506 [Hordeum vulgare subsp. vulgare]|uniref:Predicted protein n=1 Tax=Hordeum vulgare subsp. vulgare TaxID=112509 RepID=F2EFC1_HORVV|nr:uncharacterized protein LOC123413506 [Hordeum vulgare subsp. vulgare]BAK06043.1 predicted protein [Hordeum vulgare subsp. vulgare]